MATDIIIVLKAQLLKKGFYQASANLRRALLIR